MTMKLFLISVLIFSLLSMANMSMAAISLGSTTGARTAYATPGDIASFEMLLFNMHEDFVLTVYVEAEPPGDGWVVSPDPASFELDYHPAGRCIKKENYVCLNTGQGTVMARPIRLTAEIPWWEDYGEYVIEVSSFVGSGSGGMNMQQSRTYHFTVVVQEEITESQPKDASDNAEAITTERADSETSTSSDKKDNKTSAHNEAVQFSPGNKEDDNTKTVGNTTTPEGLGENAGIIEINEITGMLVAGIAEYGLFVLVVLLVFFVSWKIYKHN